MRCLSVALLVCVAPLCAAADADVLKAFGMLGRQALDCGAPPSLGNPHVTYAATPQGNVTRTQEMRHQLDGTFNLRHLRMAGPNLDLLQFIETGRTGEFVVRIARIDGKFRSWVAIGPDGSELIADGKFRGSGEPTAAFTRCP